MTIAATNNRMSYIGNGKASFFTFTFKVFLETDLNVTIRDENDLETTLILNTDYSVTLLDDGKGYIELTAGALLEGNTLTIRNIQPITQTTNIRDLETYNGSIHEDAFDKAVMIDQQQQDEISRSLKVRVSDPSGLSDIPDSASRSNKNIYFDSDGRLVVASNKTKGSVTVSSYGESLLDDDTQSKARGTLGFDSNGQFIVTGDLANNSVGTVELSDSTSNDSLRAVGTNHIKDRSITTSKLVDSSLPSSKLTGVAVSLIEFPKYDLPFATGTSLSLPQFEWTSPVALTSPSTSASVGLTSSFSPCGGYLAVGFQNSNFLRIYKKNGTSFEQVTDPATMPTGSTSGVAFSPSGEYLATAHSNSPYLTYYLRSGDTFTKSADPVSLPGSNAFDCSWSPNSEFLSIMTISSPYVHIYQRTTTGIVKLSNPASLPPSVGRASAWSSDGRFLAVTHQASPYITIYERTAGTTFTKLSDPVSLPTGDGEAVCWSPDNRFLVVGHNSSPFITIYERSGTTFTKLSDPSSIPTSVARGCAFSPSGRHLAISYANNLLIYSVSGNIFTKLPDLASPPTSLHSCCWSPVGEILVVTFSAAPYIKIYQTSYSMNENSFLTFTKKPRSGV